ncbi:MAG: hypothetical protein IH886_01625 [Nitrospinae bacterium]|nr:hypothetical protein [Nitrospinota bacterium]
MAKVKHHPAEQYALDVISKKIPACTWVIMACKRHRRDLRHGGKRGPMGQLGRIPPTT